MLMRGRCGLLVNWSRRSDGEMSSGLTPGKLVAKKVGRAVLGEDSREEKVEEGAKRVQVKERSSEGMAMNMKEPPGQMCKWFGEMAKVGEGSEREAGGGTGGIWNSHQRVSMYSCW